MTWGYWIVILVMTSLVFEFHGRGVVQQRWDKDKHQQVQLAKEAIQQREAENDALEAQQAAINDIIQKDHDEEIRKINDAFARSERLRIGASFCSEPAGQATTKSTERSDGADTTGRVLSTEVDRAVKQLILESEQAAATGRAAQAFIRENGFAE